MHHYSGERHISPKHLLIFADTIYIFKFLGRIKPMSRYTVINLFKPRLKRLLNPSQQWLRGGIFKLLSVLCIPVTHTYLYSIATSQLHCSQGIFQTVRISQSIGERESLSDNDI